MDDPEQQLVCLKLYLELAEVLLRVRGHTVNGKFELFTAGTMKNVVSWDVRLCGSCKNRRFGGTQRLMLPHDNPFVQKIK
jgi:hypothetical protein